jgi:hypothetical protein
MKARLQRLGRLLTEAERTIEKATRPKRREQYRQAWGHFCETGELPDDRRSRAMVERLRAAEAEFKKLHKTERQSKSRRQRHYADAKEPVVTPPAPAPPAPNVAQGPTTGPARPVPTTTIIGPGGDTIKINTSDLPSWLERGWQVEGDPQ